MTEKFDVRLFFVSLVYGAGCGQMCATKLPPTCRDVLLLKQQHLTQEVILHKNNNKKIKNVQN